ncbi:MAG TPA: nucleotide-binding protein [Thermodesulfobacteriota bacterium]|nr:nucleotide-binding protein [Thermodesulfobacteriota bacterium]
MKVMLSLLFTLTIISTAYSAPAATQSSEKQNVPMSKAGEPPASGTNLSSITGTVLETMDAAGYTYMRLKTSNGEIWAAVQKANVKKGSEVTIVNATPMDGFESKTLNRKFDHIVFGNLGTGTGVATSPSPLAPGHTSPMDIKAQHGGVAKAPLDVGKIKVRKAEGADGKTVAEIYAYKASLKDAPVAVRGKVVKYNPGIMGKNWIHLRDGSGSPEKSDNDITVTTLDTAAVGDVVLVRGKLHLDRDFGSGYSYPVIIEDGKVFK